MNEIILSVILLIIVSIVSVFIKLKSMGLNTGLAINKTFMYPFEIILLHLRLFWKYKNKPLRVRVRLLVFPITNPAEALNSYGIMYLQRQEFIGVLERVMNDLSDENKEKLINKLVETGTLVEANSKITHERNNSEPIYIGKNNYSLTNKNEMFC